MSQHADRKYIDALLTNDSRLLDELYEREAVRIRSWVLKNGGSASEAGDLFQDALVSLYHSAQRSDFELRCPVGALLFTMCRNRWINELRRKKREQTVRSVEAERYEVDDATVTQLEWMETQTETKRLRDRAFADLSATCQDLLRLLARGSSPAEAAKKLGMPNANTLYRRKHACAARWRALVEKLQETYR